MPIHGPLVLSYTCLCVREEEMMMMMMMMCTLSYRDKLVGITSVEHADASNTPVQPGSSNVCSLSDSPSPYTASPLLSHPARLRSARLSSSSSSSSSQTGEALWLILAAAAERLTRCQLSSATLSFFLWLFPNTALFLSLSLSLSLSFSPSLLLHLSLYPLCCSSALPPYYYNASTGS